MITFNFPKNNIINQSNYENSVNRIDFSSIACSKCGCCDGFQIHGYYERSVRTGPVKNTIRILRVICPHCKITHALLPSCMIPYTQRTLKDTLIMYRWIIKKETFNHVLISDFPSVSLSDLFILKRSFHLFKDVILKFHPSPPVIIGSCSQFPLIFITAIFHRCALNSPISICYETTNHIAFIY